MKCIVKVGRIYDPETTILVPAHESDAEEFGKLRLGSHYKANITRARNPDHHRKGMRLVRDLFENQDRYESFEDMLTELKLLAGWYSHHVRLNGEVVYLPKSISFADMDQTEFEELYSRLLDIATQHFDLDPQQVANYA